MDKTTNQLVKISNWLDKVLKRLKFIPQQLNVKSSEIAFLYIYIYTGMRVVGVLGGKSGIFIG
ncbi:MAG TPA: hypothetical protein VF411_11935 [Bacteroidia bacterium]